MGRAKVMISGLVAVSGVRSQYPYRALTLNPASLRKTSRRSASKNRRVLRLTKGSAHPCKW